jgi:hypothetical protein
MAYLRAQGFSRVGVLIDSATKRDLSASLPRQPKIEAIVDVSSGVAPTGLPSGVPRVSLADAASRKVLDAAVIVDGDQFPLLMRRAEPLARAGVVVVPGDPSMVVPDWVRLGTPQELVWKWVGVEYAARSGLKGHYVEFGTFWGASFFRAYHFLKGWLTGRFYAFDSFEGLSRPLPQEVEFTGQDFYEGAYVCNVRSFETIARLVGMDAERLRVVEGFYGDTVVGKLPSDYGLDAGSIAVCAIDCDLFEPTLQVLEFVTPLLAQGAALYFDDWRLCRSSPRVGERAAAVEWLRKHPEIELVELHRDHWQHQWFIYHSL